MKGPFLQPGLSPCARCFSCCIPETEGAGSAAAQGTAVMPLPFPRAAAGAREGRGARTPRRAAAPELDALAPGPPAADPSALTQTRTNCNPASPAPPPQPRRVCLLPYSCLPEGGGHADVLNPPAFLISLIAVWKKGKEEECSFSAWMSQSKIPAEQLKIDGQLVVRAGTSPRAWHLSPRNAAWSSGRINWDQHWSVCARDRLYCGRGAAPNVGEAGLLRLGIDNALITGIAGLKHRCAAAAAVPGQRFLLFGLPQESLTAKLLSMVDLITDPA